MICPTILSELKVTTIQCQFNIVCRYNLSLLNFQIRSIPAAAEPDSDLKMGQGDIMTWFPRQEDYEDAPVAVMPDETIEEKIDRKVVDQGDCDQIHRVSVIGDNQKKQRKLLSGLYMGHFLGSFQSQLHGVPYKRYCVYLGHQICCIIRATLNILCNKYPQLILK